MKKIILMISLLISFLTISTITTYKVVKAIDINEEISEEVQDKNEELDEVLPEEDTDAEVEEEQPECPKDKKEHKGHKGGKGHKGPKKDQENIGTDSSEDVLGDTVE